MLLEKLVRRSINSNFYSNPAVDYDLTAKKLCLRAAKMIKNATPLNTHKQKAKIPTLIPTTSSRQPSYSTNCEDTYIFEIVPVVPEQLQNDQLEWNFIFTRSPRRLAKKLKNFATFRRETQFFKKKSSNVKWKVRK